MSVTSDLAWNAEAVELANAAWKWFADNPTLEAMRNSDDQVQFADFPTDTRRVWYIQPLDGPGVKFGYVVMRPGYARHALAAACDFASSDGSRIDWVLCACATHPESNQQTLAPHLTHETLVHEATHCLDFTRNGKHGIPFEGGRKYYNAPHERHAYFHSGLYCFVNRIEFVRAEWENFRKIRGLTRAFAIIRWTHDYWRSDFFRALTRRNRRRFLRRLFRIADAYVFNQTAESAPCCPIRCCHEERGRS